MPSFLRRPEVRTALDAVREASALAARIQERAVLASRKKDRSPVSVADFAVQAVIASLLARNFPRDPLVAEESSDFLRTREGKPILAAVLELVSGRLERPGARHVCRWIDRGCFRPGLRHSRFWVLDPIDGTRGFLRGGQYAVALALVEDGKVTLGVLGCPQWRRGKKRGWIAAASRGRGAWISPLERETWRPLSVSRRKDPAAALPLASVERSAWDRSAFGRLRKRLGIRKKTLCLDSLVKFAVLAAGEADFFCRIPAPDDRRREYIWDAAPGAILLEEAGGRVTDAHGRELDFGCGERLARNLGILATNGRLHAAVLEAVRPSP